MIATARTLEVKLLGELSIRRDGTDVRLPRSKKTRALLGYLILTGRPQRRARLCSLFWDVADDPRGALRWSLSKLRPLVNDADNTRIVTDGDTVAFAPCGASIDLVTAREALVAGEGELDTETLRKIADSYRGELLEGLDMSDFDEFQAWCIAAREDARELRAQVLRTLCDRLVDEPAEALPYARALVQIEPVDEAVRARLIGTLVAAGRDAEARQQCDAGERQLRELGTNPTGALRAALADLETGDRADTAPPPRRRRETRAAEPEPVLVADTPLIGRRAERALLDSVLARVTEGREERIALISGEPGVGKTRLLVSVLDQVRAAGGTVLEGRAFEAERGRPFGPWIDALAALGPQLDASGHLAPLLSNQARAKGEHTRAQVFSAVADALVALSEQGPVALALDDVQWIDETSAELLHYVARSVRSAPILIAATARDGEIVDNEAMQRVLRSLRRERLIDELEVGPLSEGDTAELIAAIAPQANPDEVFAQCAGNPLFALEIARSGSSSTDVPRTLADVVRARVDRLPPDPADVLRWAAVLGPVARVAQLAALSTLAGDALMSALEILERHALLRADGVIYRISHDVVRHVIYNELSQPRRRLMHQQIAHSLHAEGADDEETAADLAHHANLAGNAAMAARACLAAGRRSLTLFAKKDALALARRGSRYAAELPEPDRTAVTLELWEVRLSAETPSAREEVCAELEELAERAVDAGQLSHARIGFHLLSYLRWDVGRNVDAFRHMLHAEQLTRGVEGPQRIDALSEAGRCLLKLDRDHGHAEALIREADALAKRLGVDRAALSDALGLLRSHEGDLERATHRFHEARQLARREQDRLGEFQTLEHLIMLELRRGRVEEARALTPRLVQLGTKLRAGSEAPSAQALAALVAHAEGEPGSRDGVEAALQLIRAADAKQRLGFALLAAAAIDLDHGEPAQARTYATEALELAKVMRLRSDVAWAHALLARACIALKDDAGTQRHLEALASDDTGTMAAYAREAATDVLERD